jgi:NADH-quinone oxidoreductase subunit N
MLTELIPFVPVLLVVATACTVLVTELFRRPSDQMPVAALSAIGVASALLASVLLWPSSPETAGPVTFDAYALFCSVVCCALVLITLNPSSRAATHRGMARAIAGRHALLLFALAGLMVAAAARDLAIVFLAIEAAWVSMLMYVAAGHDDEAATEAAFKTLILGAFSGAFLLYGVALMYAVTGATRLDALAARIAASSLDPHILVLVAMVLLLAGFGFVVSAVPFHMWTPDTSSGADTRAAGFVTTGLRVAGFAAFLRVWLTGLESLRVEWLPVLSAIAGVTMIVGAVAALGQTNVRRLVACVGIAHTGYFIVGLVSASQVGKAAVLVSLVAWAAANAGIFAVLAAVSRADRRHDEVRDLTGFGYARPAEAAVLTVCLLSLAGLPATAGFAARWLVLSAAMQDGLVALAVIGALTSVVLAAACARMVAQMYMNAPARTPRQPDLSRRATAGLVVVALLVVGIGLWPAPLVAAAMRSAMSIF